jgi:hypothetical protein
MSGRSPIEDDWRYATHQRHSQISIHGRKADVALRSFAPGSISIETCSKGKGLLTRYPCI